MKARKVSVCRFCDREIRKGVNIRDAGSFGWVHLFCFAEILRRQRVERGETFKGNKPSDWRRG